MRTRSRANRWRAVILAGVALCLAGGRGRRGGANAAAPAADVAPRFVPPPGFVRAPGARDAWSHAMPGVRYLRRTTRHRDGAPLIIHAVYVDLCDARVELRATAPNEGGRGVSRWARSVGASIAMNGDFFDGPGPRPLGPARGGGRDWPDRGTYYFDALLAMRAGAPPEIVHGVPRGGPWTDIVASQERIVVDGGLTLSPYVRHDVHRHPRSAVGLTRDRHTMILVVVDGRSPRSSGVTTPELGVVVQELGAWNALRMDGGGSSALFVAGRGVVNEPSDGHERAVANHLGVQLRRDLPRGVHAWCDASRSGR